MSNIKSTDITEPDLISLGEPIKKMDESERYMVVGAYGVRFGNQGELDLTGEWFAKDTDYGPHQGDGMTTTFHHCHPVLPELKALSERIFSPVKTIKDDIGIFVTAVLDMADEYERVIGKLVEAGKLRWSSGTADHLVLRDPETAQIKRWHIIEWAYTPQAAEPRLPTITSLKTYQPDVTTLVVNSQEAAKEQPDKSGADAVRLNSSLLPTSFNFKSLGGTMNLDALIEKIKALVPGLSEEQVMALANVLALALPQEAPEAEQPEEVMSAPAPTPEAMPEGLRGVSGDVMLQLMKFAAEQASTAKSAPAAQTRPAYEWKPAAKPTDEKRTDAQKAFDAFYIKRFGDDDAVKAAVLTDLVGSNYKQVIWDQNKAYASYLRRGESGLDRDAYKLLSMQILPSSVLMTLVDNGIDVKSIKDTMIEAQGTLGGYAVPPNVQNEIVSRLPGLVAVRQAGAVVITLINSNSIEIPLYTGGSDRYRGNIRGQWGTETQTPTAQNATASLTNVQAHTYTYKVPMSMSMLEDAANMVNLVTDDIVDTMALDEDDAFLVGDGVGKPYGILPGGTNGLSLTEVKSTSASALTTAGVKDLKRGIGSQYRANAAWVANSDTYSDIEALTVGGGTLNYAFPDLSDSDMLLGRRALESEAMPDVGSNTYPILFGDFRGYRIVERLGLTIQRFQDSNTGPNKVEFHVRRRIGGRVMETWRFAVQKCTT